MKKVFLKKICLYCQDLLKTTDSWGSAATTQITGANRLNLNNKDMSYIPFWYLKHPDFKQLILKILDVSSYDPLAVTLC